MTGTGLPHSEIPGSKRACRSPRLIAACRVLHRLLSPRHPSCALTSLTTKNPVRIRCRDTSCGGTGRPGFPEPMHLARPSAVLLRIASDQPGVAVLSPAVMPVQLSKSRRSESSVPSGPPCGGCFRPGRCRCPFRILVPYAFQSVIRPLDPGRCHLPRALKPSRETRRGGRAWSRTRDLVLIRDAL